MLPYEDLQRWAGRTCLLLGAALAMLGYHFANIRFAPLVAGFAILAGVCYVGRNAAVATTRLRSSGRHSAP
jgi:hypothetical protein